jgi:hypothetical protein
MHNTTDQVHVCLQFILIYSNNIKRELISLSIFFSPPQYVLNGIINLEYEAGILKNVSKSFCNI